MRAKAHEQQVCVLVFQFLAFTLVSIISKSRYNRKKTDSFSKFFRLHIQMKEFEQVCDGSNGFAKTVSEITKFLQIIVKI